MKSGLNEAMDGLGDEIIEEYRPQQDEGNNIDEWSKETPRLFYNSIDIFCVLLTT